MAYVVYSPEHEGYLSHNSTWEKDLSMVKFYKSPGIARQGYIGRVSAPNRPKYAFVIEVDIKFNNIVHGFENLYDKNGPRVQDSKSTLVNITDKNELTLARLKS